MGKDGVMECRAPLGTCGRRHSRCWFVWHHEGYDMNLNLFQVQCGTSRRFQGSSVIWVYCVINPLRTVLWNLSPCSDQGCSFQPMIECSRNTKVNPFLGHRAPLADFSSWISHQSRWNFFPLLHCVIYVAWSDGAPRFSGLLPIFCYRQFSSQNHSLYHFTYFLEDQD